MSLPFVIRTRQEKKIKPDFSFVQKTILYKYQFSSCEVYLTFMFQILSFLYWLPFRIVSNPNAETAVAGSAYVLRKINITPKLCCIATHLSALVAGFWTAFESTNAFGAVARILTTVTFFSELSIALLTLYMFVWQQDLILKVFNLISQYKLYPIKRRNRLCVTYAKLRVYFVVTTLIILSFIPGYMSINQTKVVDSITDWVVKFIKILFGVQNTPTNGILQIFQGMVWWWFFLCLRMTFVLEYNLMPLLMYSLHLVALAFIRNLRKTKSINEVIEICKGFQLLKYLCSSFTVLDDG